MKLKKIWFICILCPAIINCNPKSKSEKIKNGSVALTYTLLSAFTFKVSIEMFDLMYQRWLDTGVDEDLDKYLFFQLVYASGALAYVACQFGIASIEYYKSMYNDDSKNNILGEVQNEVN